VTDLKQNNIEAIIFDLGGVILNVDYSLAETAFQSLGLSDFGKMFSQAHQVGLFDDLETGKITPEKFRKVVKEISALDVEDNQIDQAWNSMLLDLPKERVELLQRLKEKYKTFLLSNTNKIHIDSFLQTIGNKYGEETFYNLFHKVYFSSEIGLRKPQPAIFEYVLKQNNLAAHNTLFIDDSPQHVEGAKKVGLNAVLLPKHQDITELLKDF